jgi:hypothetical protein
MTELYLSTLNTAQLVMLVWISSQAAASRAERKRRAAEERGEE